MHILFLSDNFPPEVNAPASRTHEHCRLWAAEGHQVTVVTSQVRQFRPVSSLSNAPFLQH